MVSFIFNMESLCNGEKIWDYELIWGNNRTWPEFTDCFQNTVLIWLASGWLWLTAPFYLTYLVSLPQRQMNQSSWKDRTKEILTILQLTLLAMKLIMFVLSDSVPVKYTGLIIESATLILVLTYGRLEKNKGYAAPTILCVYWAVVCTSYSVAGFSKYLKQEYVTDQTTFLLFSVYFLVSIVQLAIDCLAGNTAETLDKRQSPINTASFISRITFNWIHELISLGYRRPLTDDDLYTLNPSEQCKTVVPRFQEVWEAERKIQNTKLRNKNSVWNKLDLSKLWRIVLQQTPILKSCYDNESKHLEKSNNNNTEKAKTNMEQDKNKVKNDDANVEKPARPTVSLVKVLLKTFGFDYLLGMCCNFFNTCLHFINPILLKLIIEFVEDPSAPSWKGYCLATALLVLKFTEVFFGRQLHGMYYHTLQMRVRSALTSAIYRKSLSMNNAARVDSTAGEIVNLMSVDAEHVRHVYSMIWAFVSCPLSIILSLWFLYREVGYAMLAGLGVLLLITPINACLVKWCRTNSKLGTEEKDKRMKLMNEILNGIKVLKLYAWEMAFGKKIMDIRAKESEYVLKDRTAGMLMHFSWTLAPFAIGVATFSTYIFMGENHRLDAQTAFVAISLFDILRGNLNWLPWLITDVIKAVVSVKRLNKFLNYEDIDPDNVTANPSDDAISISNGRFRWDEKIDPCLRDINLAIPKGSLVAVVGTVGCGKSSLVSAILGEMDKLDGQVNVDGNMAYVPQQAWIQNATLRSNILFGKKVDKPKYQNVINACALKPDLDMLAAKDKTLIGEKGVNLSGGQKQRVSLARAVYFDADIYLLDDPLSAVDSHVGKHIFQNVIGKKGLLKDKTRVLVTHGIKWLPHVDTIIAMNKGAIAEVGSFDELMEHDGAFAKFMKTYLTEHNSDSDSDEEVIEMKSKALHRLDSVKLDYEESDSELEIIDSAEVQASEVRLTGDTDDTGLRQRKTRKSENTQSDAQIIKRSLSAVKDAATDEFDFDEETAENKSNDDDEEEIETGSVEMSVVVSYLKAVGHKAIILIMVLFGLEQASIVASKFWLTKWTSDSELHNLTTLPADSEERYHSNVYYLGIYGCLGVAQALAVLIYSRTRLVCSLKAGSKIHEKLLTNVLRGPMSFFDTTPIGRIVSRFSKDINSVDFGVPDQLGNMFDCVLSLICTIGVIVFNTPEFIAVILPLGIIYLVLQRFFTPTHRQIRRIESKARSPIWSHFSETLNGVGVIRAFKLQRRFEDESANRVDHYQECSYFSSALNNWLGTRMNLLGAIVVWMATVFAVASRDTLSGALVGLSVTYAMDITGCLEWMMHMISNFESDMVSLERVNQYSQNNTEACLQTSAEPRPTWPEAGKIELNSYSVRYREGLDCVLKGIDISIRPGEKVGIVGRTGAGKSSLTYSVFRLLEPASGSITIDGEDVTKFGLHDLRSRLTILPQEPVLFAGSLRMNLDPLDDHTDEELWRALEHAHLKKFIDTLPEKLKYECGEGGQNLSVGQRQLLCLARSLLRKSKILVLDEATAAVDMATDELIQQTINTEFKDCTVMTIAHRLNTVIDYDKILVLDKGEVKEFDAPKTLLADKTSIFYSMAKDAGLV